MVELGVYNGIPHLLIPVVTDPKHAAGALNWAVAEMKNRYQLMKDNKVRNIQGFNTLMEENNTPENKLPEIVIIIDELADLMLAAKNEVEDAINSLAALARAAGMYLVIATQRPSVDVVTGVIKANVPSRISFAVSSQVDSRTILDSVGAEKLLGKGDMLYAARGAIKPVRIQGNFISDSEIENVIGFVKKQYEAEYDDSILEHIEREQENREAARDDDSHTRSGDKDELFVKAAELAFESGQASVAMLQRKYKIGYQRAARIIDQLEENHIIGPYEGTKPRQVLISRNELNEMLMHSDD
jgi:S-DNA-T family DNA segregation ATPase FtsK/SpoIIIE